MASRHETISLTESDLREAVQEWLDKKYGSHSPFTLSFACNRSSHGSGWAEVDTETFTATATRKIS